MRNQSMPSDTDALFIPDSTSEAWLKTSEKSFFLYSEGYRLAGENLYEEISKNEYFHKRFLTYPMIFCFRQFIELRLKELILMGKGIIDLPKDFPVIHSINKLFDFYETEILPKVDSNIDAVLFVNTKKLIDELDKIDNNSMSFRYPLLKKQGGIMPPSITMSNMDIHNFKTVIDKLSNFFDYQLEIMHYSEEMKKELYAEMEAILRSEYESSFSL